MRILDAGHNFELAALDGEFKQTLRFVKREGNNYPGHVGAYPGTTIQEVLRACISRLNYLDYQIPCNETPAAKRLLQEAILLLEMRAKRTKGKYLPTLSIDSIDHYDACRTCGHIFCKEPDHSI